MWCHTFIAKLETGLGSILERNVLPSTKVSEKNLIQGFSEEKNLITTGVEFLNEYALSEVLRGLAHLGNVEDLLLALLHVLEVLTKITLLILYRLNRRDCNAPYRNSYHSFGSC